jgi:hypothetical protein
MLPFYNAITKYPPRGKKEKPGFHGIFLHSPHVLCLRGNYFIRDTKIIVFNIG